MLIRLEADAIRLQIAPYVGAPHGYYVVSDDRSTTGQSVFCFKRGDDIFAALDEVRRTSTPPRLPAAYRLTRYVYTQKDNSLEPVEQTIGWRKSCSSLDIEVSEIDNA